MSLRLFSLNTSLRRRCITSSEKMGDRKHSGNSCLKKQVCLQLSVLQFNQMSLITMFCTIKNQRNKMIVSFFFITQSYRSKFFIVSNSISNLGTIEIFLWCMLT